MAGVGRTHERGALELVRPEIGSETGDNFYLIPEGEAVFGIFGVINNTAVNCRFAGETDNLRKAVKMLFDNPGETGLKNFLQGEWIQLLQYELMPDSSVSQRMAILDTWLQQYKPGVNAEGEYPGYY